MTAPHILDPAGLLGQHRPDQAHYRCPVGEDAYGVGAAADLSVEPLGRVVGPNLGPDVLRERGEGQDVRPGGVEVGSFSLT